MYQIDVLNKDWVTTCEKIIKATLVASRVALTRELAGSSNLEKNN